MSNKRNKEEQQEEMVSETKKTPSNRAVRQHVVAIAGKVLIM